MNLTSTKIVISGATGFLGFALLKQMLKEGLSPIALVRRDTDSNRLVSLEAKFVYYEHLTDDALILTLVNMNPEVFIHCAWKSSGNKDRNSPEHFTYNVPLALDSVSLAQKIGCRSWVGIGSQAEYGVQNRKLSETMPLNPSTIYGQSKVSVFWGARAMCQYFGIKMIWTRIFSLYGPYDNPEYFIPSIIRQIINHKAPELTSCEQKWDYLFIDDAAEAIMSLIHSKEEGVFNIGSGKTVTLFDVAEMIKAYINPSIQIKYGAFTYNKETPMYLEANIEKIKKATGWNPKFELSEGILKTIDYYVSLEK